MPKVRVPRKNVTLGEVVAAPGRRLGPGYQVEANGSRVIVRKSQLAYATIAIAASPGASVSGSTAAVSSSCASPTPWAPPDRSPTPCAALRSSAASKSATLISAVVD
jgi:hypothetical protein